MSKEANSDIECKSLYLDGMMGLVEEMLWVFPLSFQAGRKENKTR